MEKYFKMCVYIYIYILYTFIKCVKNDFEYTPESFCCTPETNTTL